MKPQETAHYATICGFVVLVALIVVGLNIPVIWRAGIVVIAATAITLLLGPYPGPTPMSD